MSLSVGKLSEIPGYHDEVPRILFEISQGLFEEPAAIFFPGFHGEPL